MNINRNSLTDLAGLCRQKLAKASQEGFTIPEHMQQRRRFVDSTPLEDIFERTSYEESMLHRVDSDELRGLSHRDYELFDDELDADYVSCLHHNYDENDVPLSEGLIRKEMGYRPVPSEYYPDTHLDSGSIDRLNKIQQKETLLRRMDDVYGDKAYFISDKLLNMVEQGIPVEKIIDMLSDSILCVKGRSGRKSLDLFNFLIKNPQQRSLVVVKDANGTEMLDRVAMKKFPELKQLFLYPKHAEEVIELCKMSGANGLKLTNSHLCDVISMLESRNNIYRINNASKAEIDTPVLNLMNYLKSDSCACKERCNVVIDMINDDKSVSEILDFLKKNNI